ncbi:MAG: beta-ketoacyl-ACP synthase II [Oscillospiraceae bacterium]|nr:beta-ketoacyl-ACP synthase II [Oscillospiraceae bacterium]
MRRVVVTGLGIISPIGNDVPTFWESLVSGKCGIGKLTRFDPTEYKPRLAAEVKDFDATKYMDKAEVRKNDLFAQYAMASAVQAMQDSGIHGTVDPTRFGVYVGSGIGGIMSTSAQLQVLAEKGPRRVSPHTIPMMIGNMAGGIIAIRYGLMGPNMCISTACATSTNAIGEAYRCIAHGYADAMVAGGAEAAITPLAVAAFGNCMALHTGDDPAAASIPFDARRSGFIMGEGGGILILEEYEHAKARGAKIYAEMAGYGHTNDAHHVTAPDPSAEGGAGAIRQAYEQSGVHSERIYINAHGTSTQLNDSSETLAIKKALGEELARKVMISSTKSMTGHMLGGAGAAEAIAAILALNNSLIPPTIGYCEPDPVCDLDYVPNTARKADLDLVLSDSLGFGGHNGCVAFKKVQ